MPSANQIADSHQLKALQEHLRKAAQQSVKVSLVQLCTSLKVCWKEAQFDAKGKEKMQELNNLAYEH
jgi:hypothetical protein